jgi:RHS repeat-associated protein
VEYRYDLVGNMLGQTTSGSVSSGTAYRYDDADQMLEAVTRGTGAGTVKYRYDEQGNQVQAGGDTFTYNLDHTTATATVGGVRTSYTYDAQRLRLSAVTDAANGPRSKAWAQDVNASLPRLALETTSTPSSSTSRGFLNGAKGAALGLLTGGRADVFVPDWLGGVADVVSPDGATVASYDYEPYGAARTDGTAAGRPSSVDNPIRFTGAYQDTTIGSRYTFPARNYDPATGRFATLDPVGAGSATPATSGYAYAAGRPTTATDPSGAIPIIPPGPVFTPRVTGPECSAATPEYCHSPGSNKKTAHDLGVEWLSGAIAGCPDGSTGSCYTEELFREKDKFTNQIREMKSFHQSVDRVAEQLPYTRAGEGGNENYHFAQMTPEERRDIAERTGRSIFTSGAQGMSIALAFLGSYDLDWKFLGNDDNFNPVVEFHLTNASTKGSASLDPGKVQDYGEDSSAGDGHDAQPGERWLHQSVRWRETFPDGKAPKLPTGKQTVPCPPLGMTCEHDPDSYDRTFPWWFPLPQLPELWPM